MICRSSWFHLNTEQWLDQWSQKMKGVTQVPSKKKKKTDKHWFPFHILLIPGEHFLELSCSAQCHSGYENPWTVLYVFYHTTSRHFLTCKCRKGGLVFCCGTITMSLTFCLLWSHLTRIRIRAVHSLKSNIFCWSGLRRSACINWSLRKLCKPEELIWPQAKCSNYVPSIIQRLRKWVNVSMVQIVT